MDLGKRIKARMQAKKISSKAMADACGVTPSAVSSWYRTNRISKDALAKVATVLDVSLEELITGESVARPAAPAESPSATALYLARWLDKVQDQETKERIAHVAMLEILKVIDGPGRHTTQEPSAQSKTPHGARLTRSK